jgi:hypothetical protein
MSARYTIDGVEAGIEEYYAMKQEGRYFASGWIVRYMGGLYIVAKTKHESDKYLSLLSATHSNSTTGVSAEPTVHDCSCDFDSWGYSIGYHDKECELCHGSGKYTLADSDIDAVQVVARSMMEFIQSRAMAVFE